MDVSKQGAGGDAYVTASRGNTDLLVFELLELLRRSLLDHARLLVSVGGRDYVMSMMRDVAAQPAHCLCCPCLPARVPT